MSHPIPQARRTPADPGAQRSWPQIQPASPLTGASSSSLTSMRPSLTKPAMTWWCRPLRVSTSPAGSKTPISPAAITSTCSAFWPTWRNRASRRATYAASWRSCRPPPACPPSSSLSAHARRTLRWCWCLMPTPSSSNPGSGAQGPASFSTGSSPTRPPSTRTGGWC